MHSVSILRDLRVLRARLSPISAQTELAALGPKSRAALRSTSAMHK
jgi:hypothetical protein